MSNFVRFSTISTLLWLTGCGTTSTIGSSDTTTAPIANKPVAAAEELREELPKITLTRDVLYDLLVGEMAAQRGQVGTTAELLGGVAQRTRDPRVAERATLAAFYSRRFEDALRSATLWVELRPKDVEAHEALATVLLELGKVAEAQSQLEQLLALEDARGRLDQGYLRAATVLGRQSSRATTAEIMHTLVKLNPESAAAHLYAAHLAVRAGDLNEAGVSAETALRLRPDWEDAAVFRVRVLISQKDAATAHKFYQSFLDKYPKSASVRLNYARFLIDQKQWDKAFAQFKRLLSDTPDDADATYAAGLLALQNNLLTDARRYLERTVELRPDNDQARLYLGQIAEQEKNYEDAKRWYKEIDDGDSYFEAQTHMAVVLSKQGDIDAARRHLQSIQPENDLQRVQRALVEEQILRDAKRHREALGVLNEAIVAVPGDKDLLYARALIAEKLDMLDIT